MQTEVNNLKEKLSKITEHWSPRVIAELNDYQFKLVKLYGEFVWHSHLDTDEAFLVIDGEMQITFTDHEITLKTEDIYVVPKGVTHRPFAKEECHVLLIEPRGVVNTGETGGELTAKNDVWLKHNRLDISVCGKITLQFEVPVHQELAMPNTLLDKTELVNEDWALHISPRPINFEQFLEMSGDLTDIELVNGVIVEKMAAQYPHELRFIWLSSVLNMYVKTRGLGVVLGSRSAVKINQFGGRLPDLLFIHKDRMNIITNNALMGAPNLVIEIVSSNDRRSDLVALETDYRSIGVTEIVFIDPQRQQWTVIRKVDDDYDVEVLTKGEFTSTVVPGFHLNVEWLLNEDLPNEMEVLTSLLNQ